ncbi:DUF6328 family protein [Herbiconiux sp. VKM Ac-2851]|uniref:DUF6328 family protein n=1 Tax=Herbiconiux sp. VKM Ac-2851 TaxID=2739025 RepID=UPI001566F441|nr:DUF6328 family protein [Herbiconiux sp. VKM Ac-2851]NQX37188.1 sodium:proton antiporter [Herbiconiux sp. VKM Ac-2851]
MPQERGKPDRDSSGRRETVNLRNDRNWAELIQEVRVIHPAIRIMTGFLLLTFLQTGFTDVDRVTETIYVVVLIIAILTTLTGLAPVAIHRTLFASQAKRATVDISDITLRVCLCGFGLMLVGTATLIFDVAIDHTAGAIVGISVFAAIVITWVVVPICSRRFHARRP